jgi:hypothetical protein
MNITQSIEQLENEYWQETDFPTSLVERCFRYRKIPVGDLTTEQLRTLIGQQIGLKYLVPLALKFLEQNLLTEADLYEGDLLASVLAVDAAFWWQNPSIKLEVRQLILDGKENIKHRDDINQFQNLLKKMEAFVSA